MLAGGWEGHEPEQTCELVAGAIREAGLGARIERSLDALTDAALLRSCRVIVPCWTMGAMTPEQEQGLLGAVRAGAGLAGWHGGMGDAFRSSSAYQFAVGGQFVAHPGNFVDYRVNISDREHSITAGMGEFDVYSEQYYMHVDPANRVLATTTFTGEHAPEQPWIAGAIMPVVWTRRYGEGRVAYSALGHSALDLAREPARTLAARCVLWAAGMLDGAGGPSSAAEVRAGGAR
jgi:type 1 glutamine amidotransferase